MSSENVSATFPISTVTPILTTGHYMKKVKLWETEQVTTYSKVFKSVEVTSIVVTMIQYGLVDSKGVAGPKPRGAVRFGVVPEKVATSEYENFSAIAEVPHLRTVALSENDQVTAAYSIPGHTLSTLEVDLAASARREARPVVVLANSGYTHPKEAKVAYDLCMAQIDFEVKCSGYAFGL